MLGNCTVWARIYKGRITWYLLQDGQAHILNHSRRTSFFAAIESMFAGCRLPSSAFDTCQYIAALNIDMLRFAEADRRSLAASLQGTFAAASTQTMGIEGDSTAAGLRPGKKSVPTGTMLLGFGSVEYRVDPKVSRAIRRLPGGSGDTIHQSLQTACFDFFF